MRKSTYANIPPATETLSDGRIRVNYNVVETTEEREIIDPETGEPTGETETVTVYVCDTVIVDKFDYVSLIVALIRQKYSVNDELAILRQRDSKVEDFNAYNTFAEECKVIAKQFFNE